MTVLPRKAASLATQATAIGWAVFGVIHLAFSVVYQNWLSGVITRGSEPLEPPAIMEVLSQISRVTFYLCLAGLFVAMVLVFRAVEDRRSRWLVVSALISVAIDVAITVFENFVQPSRSSSGISWQWPALWCFASINGYAGPGLSLFALGGSGRFDRWARLSLLGYYIAALGAFSIILLSTLRLATSLNAGPLGVTRIAASAAANLLFAFAAFRAGKHFSAIAPAEELHSSNELDRQPVDGSPLRLFGWATLFRIGLMLLLAVAQAVALVNSNTDAAQGVLVLGTFAGVCVSAVLAFALLGALRMPSDLRSGDALVFAMIALCIGPLLDIWAAASGSQLFSALSEAKRATSFWGMPSISKMESLQETMTWLGRVSLALGVAAAVAIVHSFRIAANALQHTDLVGLAARARLLLLIGGIGGLALGALVPHAKNATLPLLVMGALALLAIAIWMISDLLRLTFGLAAALEQGKRPA
jgi:hypothetical protein